MTITRNFKLCLNAGTQNAPYINVNQYDEGEEWVFDLYTEGGQKFTPSTGAIIGIKSDGNAILNSGTVNAGGQVVITETQQMTAASGLAVFELLIEGETHGTANFIVNVERRPSDDAEFSDSDLSMLQEAIDAAEVINEVLDEGGDPSEIITENVNNWLDNHPEATTTVQDGAITAPKINNSLWDKILVNEEVSGNPASFDDGADDVPVSSLKVNLEPIQTGTGDPSPSNVRPISGQSTVTVGIVGKSLLPHETNLSSSGGITFTDNADGSITTNGIATAQSNNRYLYSLENMRKLEKGVRYRLSGCPEGGSNSTYKLQVWNGTAQTYLAQDYGSGAEFVLPNNDDSIRVRFVIYANVDMTGKTFYPMITVADADPTYEPCNETNYPIALGREVYGGSVDLATGVLTVTHQMVDLGSLTWGVFNANNTYTATPQNMASIITPPYTNRQIGAICSSYPPSSNYAYDTMDDKSWLRYRNNIVIHDDSYTDATAFKNAVDGVQLVYELAEPQTHQLTPTQVKTLLGYNNISSTGTVDVIYHADTKLYIDKKIGELS